MISGLILVLMALAFWFVAKSFHGAGYQEGRADGYNEGWDAALREIVRRGERS